MYKKLMLLVLFIFFGTTMAGCTTKENADNASLQPNKSIANSEDALKLVIQPCWDPEESHEMFKPMAEYLKKETGRDIQLVIPDTEEDFYEIMESENVFALQGSFSAYIHNSRGFSMSKPLFMTVTENGETEEKGSILVKADSDIKSLDDLAGKSFLFGAKYNSPKFFATYVTLKRAGINIESDLKEFGYGGECSDNSMAVFLGEYDAGVACKDYVEGDEGKKDFDFKTDLRVITDTVGAPSTMLTVSEKIDKDAVEQVRTAMMKLEPESELAEKIMEKTEWSGFEEAKGNELEEVAELVKTYSVPTE